MTHRLSHEYYMMHLENIYIYARVSICRADNWSNVHPTMADSFGMFTKNLVCVQERGIDNIDNCHMI